LSKFSDTDERGRWAAGIAAQLPPLEPEAIAVIGRLAAVLDARREAADVEAA
jgi:hypothetical protein